MDEWIYDWDYEYLFVCEGFSDDDCGNPALYRILMEDGDMIVCEECHEEMKRLFRKNKEQSE